MTRDNWLLAISIVWMIIVICAMIFFTLLAS
jgi:hypothetical protein